jgi:hypothetical protein
MATKLEIGDTVVVSLAGAVPGVDQFTPLVVEAIHNNLADLTLADRPNGAGYMNVPIAALTKIGA